MKVPASRLCILVVLLVAICGCSQKSDDDGGLKTTAQINNNAPEAKNAPAAPVNPSIMMPGGKMKAAKATAAKQ